MCTAANRYGVGRGSPLPPSMGVPVLYYGGACAWAVARHRHGAYCMCVPDPLRAAAATSAIRVRISTGSSPLHSDARVHHFFSLFSSFFPFFSFSFLVFCSPYANNETRAHVRQQHATRTLCRLSSLVEKKTFDIETTSRTHE